MHTPQLNALRALSALRATRGEVGHHYIHIYIFIFLGLLVMIQTILSSRQVVNLAVNNRLTYSSILHLL